MAHGTHVPFSLRNGASIEAFDKLHDGVPDWIRPSIEEWSTWFLSDRTDSDPVVAEISRTLRLPTRRGRPGPESGDLSDRQCSGPSPIAFGAKEFHALDFALLSVQLLV